MLGTLLLHGIARVALRAQTPLRAKRTVDAFARWLPALSLGEAMRVAQELEGSGTCLTRALTIAARLTGSQVVIGSDGTPDEKFAAHAWVERDGTIVSASMPSRYEIARL
jgi:Transglutaminase-like superfamily